MRRIAVLALFGHTLTSPAFAHHGWGSYDDTKVIRITAPVEKMTYENPHAERIIVDGKRIELR